MLWTDREIEQKNPQGVSQSDEYLILNMCAEQYNAVQYGTVVEKPVTLYHYW
jgi:hypothetical protein